MPIHEMMTYLNHHPEDDVQTRIIRFQLNNFKSIAEMNIIKMSQLCYVSTASISRIASKFGFDSYEDMKQKIIQEMTTPDPNVTYRMNKDSLLELKNHPETFFPKFAAEFANSIQDTAQTVSTTEIDAVLKKIIAAKNVTLFGFDTMLESLKIFQASMLICGFVVSVGEQNETQLVLANKLTQESLAIVFSSFGTFFSKLPKVYDEIIQSNAHTLLITQASGNIYSNSFDSILRISSSPNTESGSYPMNFLLEYMARRMFFLVR